MARPLLGLGAAHSSKRDKSHGAVVTTELYLPAYFTSSLNLQIACFSEVAWFLLRLFVVVLHFLIRSTISGMPAKRRRTSNGSHAPAPDGDINGSNGVHFTAPEDINDDPERVKFAYWVPNVSGGLVISKIPQKTSYDTFAMK